METISVHTLHVIKTYPVLRLDPCYRFQGSLLKSGLDIRVGSPSAWAALVCSGFISSSQTKSKLQVDKESKHRYSWGPLLVRLHLFDTVLQTKTCFFPLTQKSLVFQFCFHFAPHRCCVYLRLSGTLCQKALALDTGHAVCWTQL